MIGLTPWLVFVLLMARSGSATGQYFYLQGLLLASPSMARATTNLAPGITFAIAAVIGCVRLQFSPFGPFFLFCFLSIFVPFVERKVGPSTLRLFGLLLGPFGQCHQEQPIWPFDMTSPVPAQILYSLPVSHLFFYLARVG